ERALQLVNERRDISAVFLIVQVSLNNYCDCENGADCNGNGREPVLDHELHEKREEFAFHLFSCSLYKLRSRHRRSGLEAGTSPAPEVYQNCLNVPRPPPPNTL